MSNINMQLTQAGLALKAKIELGNGDIPLHITKIVSGSGKSDTPEGLNAVVNPEQEFTIMSRTVDNGRTTIKAMINNFSLTDGYSMHQIGFYAEDPDDGEILYRITQFDEPRRVPASHEAGWTYTPEFNFAIHNASDVTVVVDPSGLALKSEVEGAIDAANEAKATANTSKDDVTRALEDIEQFKDDVNSRLDELSTTGIVVSDSQPADMQPGDLLFKITG